MILNAFGKNMSYLTKVKRKAINLYRREILRDQPLLEAKRWFRDRGDTTLRLKYELTPDSVVIDVGGYVGDFAHQINSLYGSTVHMFEPVPAFYARCVQRFTSNPKIHLHCYGLGSDAGTFPISDDADASSLFASIKSSIFNVEVRPIVDSFEALGITSVDLLKLNIEGGEYQVLPALIEAGWLPRIRWIQVQFHTCGDDYVGARNAILRALEKTHRQTWCYKFVWENWERRD